MKEWIDLSHELTESTLPFPGDDALSVEWLKTYDQDGYTLSKLHTSMHIGTHIDYKKHILDVEDEIDLGRLIGKANTIRIKQSHGLILTKDVEKAYGSLKDQAKILLINTGHHHLFNRQAYYDDYPKFQESIIDFLTSNNIQLLGSDLPSYEFKEGKMLRMHQMLFKHDIYIIENLNDLDALNTLVEFIALPLPIKGLEGSLIRPIAKNL